MKKCLEYEPVYVIRPLLATDWGNEEPYLRYSNGEWIEDDGEFGLAFISLNRPFAYGVNVRHRENIIWSWCKDMQWGATVRGHPRGNAWHYMLRDGETKWGDCWNRSMHPNTIAFDAAMQKCSSRSGCANGISPEFEIYNQYIKRGFLRTIDGEIITPPDRFICMYCGEIDTTIDRRSQPKQSHVEQAASEFVKDLPKCGSMSNIGRDGLD